MSFASDVKEEIGKQYDKGRHCQIAQLAVIFALTGHIKSCLLYTSPSPRD